MTDESQRPEQGRTTDESTMTALDAFVFLAKALWRTIVIGAQAGYDAARFGAKYLRKFLSVSSTLALLILGTLAGLVAGAKLRDDGILSIETASGDRTGITVDTRGLRDRVPSFTETNFASDEFTDAADTVEDAVSPDPEPETDEPESESAE